MLAKFWRNWRAKNIAETTDFGRRHGWHAMLHGECIADLEYFAWDENSQFWHTYRIVWRTPQPPPFSHEAWAESHVILRNRRYPQVELTDYLSAFVADDRIALRGVHVPLDVLAARQPVGS